MYPTRELELRAAVHEDIHVALADRPREIKELLSSNPSLFDAIKRGCFNQSGAWEDFCRLLTASRNELGDLAWMKHISKYLSHQPALLAAFKELVGFGKLLFS